MVRKGKAEDCRSIYELICDMEEKELPWDTFSQMYGEMLADSRHVFLVWEEEKQVKGVLHLLIERQLHHAALVAEIMEFAVDKDARSNGIGGEMLTYASTWQKKRAVYRSKLPATSCEKIPIGFICGKACRTFIISFPNP